MTSNRIAIFNTIDVTQTTNLSHINNIAQLLVCYHESVYASDSLI